MAGLNLDFKPYLNSLIFDKEFSKWERLYVPLHISESAGDLPDISSIRDIVLEESKKLQEQGLPLPEGLTWTKHKATIKDIIEDIKNNHHPLILIGESGTGKTTSLQYLTILYAKQCLEDVTQNPNEIPTSLVPIYLDMSGFRTGEFVDYIISELNNRKLYLTHNELSMLLDKNIFLVLIDGLDLLCPYSGFNPIDSIQRFINQYPKNRFVLTCRKGVCYTSFPANYKVIELLELSQEDVKEYLKYYVKDTEKRESLLKTIAQDANLKEISETPLLLLLMIATFIRYKKIPHNKTDVYSAYINCIYDLFERMGKLGTQDKKIIEEGLARIGFILQLHNATVLNKQEIIKLFKNISDKVEYKENPPEELLQLCTQLGFLKLQGQNVKFFYQSFREYFAAERLKQLFLNNVDLSDVYTHPRWEDVIVFLAGLLDTKDASRLVKEMLEISHKYCNPLFLAAECVAGSKVEDDIRDKVLRLLEDKLNDKYWYNQREALYGIVKMTGKVRTHAEEGIGVSREKAVDIFIQRLKDEDWIRREKSAQALGRISDKGIIPYLEKLLQDSSPAVYNAAFEAIIEIERREKENTVLSFPGIEDETLFKVIPEQQLKEEEKRETAVEQQKMTVVEHEQKKIIPRSGTTTLVFINIIRTPEIITQSGESRVLTGLQFYNNTIKPYVEGEGGRILKLTGGTCMALFDTPVDGINACIKIQEAIDEYNLRQPSRKIYVRIGIAAGSPQPKDSLSSVEVKLAIKIGLVAVAGQILVSEEVYKRIKEEETSVKFRYSGSRRLFKDDTKISIYELLWRGESYASMIKESVMAVEYLDIVSGYNVTKNIQISTSINIARGFFKRFKGLMFTKSPNPLLMEYPHPTGTRVSVRTLFVPVQLDIVWLDSSFKVVDIVEKTTPFSPINPATWKTYTSQRLAKYVLELPAGRVYSANIEIGDVILFKEQSM